MSAHEVNDDNIKDEISNGITVVDFWADWCQPCKMLANTIDELSENYKDKVSVVKMNIEDNKSATSEFGISSLPTVVIFKDGEQVERIIGLNPIERYQKAINSLL